MHEAEVGLTSLGNPPGIPGLQSGEEVNGRGTLWAPSYFIATAGNVSAETIRRYIEEQRMKGR